MSSIPIVASAVDRPAVLGPAADLFNRRAARLRHLADGHAMEVWLQWLARLAEAQQAALREPAEPQALRAILAGLAAALPETAAARDAAALDAVALAQRLERSQRHARGEAIDTARDAIDVLIGAAWQVQATAAALATPLPAAGAGAAVQATQAHCPCCGSLAHGSLLQAGDGVGGLRYQECSACGTRWHAVRARCTVCDDGEVVNYLSLESEQAAVAAETCDACHGYSKVFFQTRDAAVEPLADDLATLALDVLVGEQGYARAAPNLLLAEGEALG